MSFKIQPVAGATIVSAKLGTDTVANGGGLTDADIGKPVKLSAADTYSLCAAGDQIDGFLVGINPETQDGYTFGSVQIDGYVRVELSGAATVGSLVAAATPAAAGTAEANGLGKVQAHTLATADVASLAASIFAINWRVVSGTGLDGDTTAVIEKC